MGSGYYSADVYSSTIGATRNAGGDTFAYSTHTMNHTPVHERKAHQTLDPNGIDVREARDSDDHPTAVPIVVIFDVTGSMAAVPRQLQADLPQLLGTLTLGGYIEHPQLLMGAVTDSYSGNRIPLQVGQFEADNRIDENLANIVLEGGGGGGNHESYELAFYFLARKTATDHFEKRGHKGYAFIIGDERSHLEATTDAIERVFGDTIPQALSVDELLAEAQEKWEIFFLCPAGTWGAQDATVEEFWTSRIGQNFVRVPDVAKVGETIASLAASIENTP